MARPLRITFPGAFYHITSRGNERKSVYKNERDREKFFEYLESAAERYNAVVHVFCLMQTERGQVSTIDKTERGQVSKSIGLMSVLKRGLEKRQKLRPDPLQFALQFARGSQALRSNPALRYFGKPVQEKKHCNLPDLDGIESAITASGQKVSE